MTYESPYNHLWVGHWVLEGMKETFVWFIESLIMGNFGFVLSTLWIVALFWLKSTRFYSIGAVVLWLLFQM